MGARRATPMHLEPREYSHTSISQSGTRCCTKLMVLVWALQSTRQFRKRGGAQIGRTLLGSYGGFLASKRACCKRAWWSVGYGHTHFNQAAKRVLFRRPLVTLAVFAASDLLFHRRGVLLRASPPAHDVSPFNSYSAPSLAPPLFIRPGGT